VDIVKVTAKRGFGHYEKVTQIDTRSGGTGGKMGLHSGKKPRPKNRLDKPKRRTVLTAAGRNDIVLKRWPVMSFLSPEH
jgi:hypothetical protein